MDTIYLDNHASTQCDPRVVEAMIRYLCRSCGDPSSFENRVGKAPEFRWRLRALRLPSYGVRPNEIIFTSGATESNNLAILFFFRLARGVGERERRNRVVTFGHGA